MGELKAKLSQLESLRDQAKNGNDFLDISVIEEMILALSPKASKSTERLEQDLQAMRGVCESIKAQMKSLEELTVYHA